MRRPNTFWSDVAYSKDVRDRILVPQFYEKYVMNGRFVLMDKGRLAKELQRREIDTVVQARDGGVVTIEEKIVRWKGYHYRAFSLETHSCTRPGRESEGWMRYGQADYLLYCFHQADDGLKCHLIDFPALQAWFAEREDSFPPYGPLDTLNAAKGRVVEIAAIKDAGIFISKTIECHGDPALAPQALTGGRPEGGRAHPPQ